MYKKDMHGRGSRRGHRGLGPRLNEMLTDLWGSETYFCDS